MRAHSLTYCIYPYAYTCIGNKKFELKLSVEEVSALVDGDLHMTDEHNMDLWIAVLNKIVLKPVEHFSEYQSPTHHASSDVHMQAIAEEEDGEGGEGGRNGITTNTSSRRATANTTTTSSSRGVLAEDSSGDDESGLVDKLRAATLASTNPISPSPSPSRKKAPITPTTAPPTRSTSSSRSRPGPGPTSNSNTPVGQMKPVPPSGSKPSSGGLPGGRGRSTRPSPGASLT